MNRFPLLPLALLLATATFTSPKAFPQDSSSSEPRPSHVSNEGPWGIIEYVEVPIDCPETLLPSLDAPSQQTVWHVPATTEEELRNFLRQGGLSEDQIRATLDGSTLMVNADSARIFPKDESLLALDAGARSSLYRVLASVEENLHQRRPAFFNVENLSVWFQGSGTPRHAIQTIAMLAYPTPRQRGYFFSDLPLLMKALNSSVEERTVLRALRRQTALMATLTLESDSSLAEISDYWTAGFKNKAVLPLLESVAAAGPGGSIDIAHLLPATPRSQLNRFPEFADGLAGRFPDWFWTCYNFFRFTPKDVYADSLNRDRLLIDEFEPTLPPHRFGDLILFNNGTSIIHGCVYVADEIVFTKNSADVYSPWVFMKLDDVVAHHDIFGNVSLSTFRKETPPQVPTR